MNQKTKKLAVQALRDLADAIDNPDSGIVGFEIYADSCSLSESIRVSPVDVAVLRAAGPESDEDIPLPF